MVCSVVVYTSVVSSGESENTNIVIYGLSVDYFKPRRGCL